jgi:ABC-type nitrate/sulfonate/bicarbonate transport system substrate-binding protein
MEMRVASLIGLTCLTLLNLSATPSAFAQLTRLKTSYSALTANMAAYWLAKDAKIFEKHGLNVDVVLIESGVTTVQALTAGETQIAMGGGTVAVSSNLAGSDIISIASIESRLPYALLAQKEIKSIDQLKGKRLAVSRFRQRFGSRRASHFAALWSDSRQRRHPIANLAAPAPVFLRSASAASIARF